MQKVSAKVSRKDLDNVKIDMIIGKKILALRAKYDVTRKVLAEKLRVTNQQLAKYETGANRICIGRLLTISKFFNQSLHYFLDDIDNQASTYDKPISVRDKLCLEASTNFTNLKSMQFQVALNNFMKEVLKISTITS